jgi:hypothetical protein
MNLKSLKVRRVIAGVFDFYFNSLLLAVLLMIYTTIIGPVPIVVTLSTLCFNLILTTSYHLNSLKFTFISTGELITGIEKGLGIIQIKNRLKFSRIPFLIMTFINLLFTTNLLDSLSEGKVFNFSNIIYVSALFGLTLYSIRNFYTFPKLVNLILILGQVFILVYQFRANSIISNILYVFIVLWCLVGIFYIWNFKKVETSSSAL